MIGIRFTPMSLSDTDANLYRLYAVGKITYEDALRQAQSSARLRRALLQFDQNARPRDKPPPPNPNPDPNPNPKRGKGKPQE